MTETENNLISLYAKMYELTEPECSGSCRAPRSCCSPEYCLMAQEYAQETWGVELEATGFDNPKQLPLMGPEGCAVAPHFRPWCTFHTCAINGFGFKPGDEAWNTKYWEVRGQIEELELERFEEKER